MMSPSPMQMLAEREIARTLIARTLMDAAQGGLHPITLANAMRWALDPNESDANVLAEYARRPLPAEFSTRIASRAILNGLLG